MRIYASTIPPIYTRSLEIKKEQKVEDKAKEGQPELKLVENKAGPDPRLPPKAKRVDATKTPKIHKAKVDKLKLKSAFKMRCSTGDLEIPAFVQIIRDQKENL